ncbi:MAG TPA: HAD family hydrolase [Acidimicrobiales bacterium]|nr:HAD family hydrolase [Acidimicrobiales bacterium]
MIEVVALDGDDTLWHNELQFSMTQARFCELVAPYAPDADLDDKLLSTERMNLTTYGYGVKSFTLSMVETAIEVSQGHVPVSVIEQILDAGKAMLSHPVELLDGVVEAVDALRDRYALLVITKGDLFHQESKLARSGLAERFHRVHIVSEKDEATYQRIIQGEGVPPERFLMAGNSLRSDVLPVAALGAHAVHVPFHTTWIVEHVEPEEAAQYEFSTISSLWELPSLIEQLDS